MPHVFDLWGESRGKRLYFDFSFIYCIPYTIDNFSRYLIIRTFVVAWQFLIKKKKYIFPAKILE